MEIVREAMPMAATLPARKARAGAVVKVGMEACMDR